MKKYPKFKACAAHAAPVYLDPQATTDKACSLIAEAARNGASLIAFPESFLPGFPVWAAVQSPIRSHDMFKILAASSVEVPGPEIRAICTAARRHEIFVSIGISEATRTSVGCLWNSNLLIGADGSILNHHRKLVPTFYEKMIWANGDGAGLRVTETEIGRVGMLICGENTNPLARYALMAQGEQFHISTYPPTWPTRPPEEAGRYDLSSAIRIRAGAHAFEAKVFNLVSSALVDDTMLKAIAHLGEEAVRIIKETPSGETMLIGPSGEVIGDTLRDDEGLLYCEIDLANCVEAKQFHDVVGYYNRFDIFHLKFDATPQAPIEIVGRENFRAHPYEELIEPEGAPSPQSA
ncbi:carbon-nitrogen hydrolase family protein [uncultured Roseibium sp.]|uniref:carbon-nitrogen hydrolase family protein n=1 Tax=uncultured Roseibium sp. TaxID=1936171 RepID=UPI003216CD89